MRYQTPDATQRVRNGIRRVLLLNASTDADATAIDSLADTTDGMAASAFGADDVGWVSAKGRAWTHVWEQAFTDTAQLQRYLRSRDGISCSSLEGFTRLDIRLSALKVFTCPFELTPVEHQTPAPTPQDDKPVLYTIIGRTARADVEQYIDLLERLYDPFMVECGTQLVHRWRTDRGHLECEVHSTWELGSYATYSHVRLSTYAHPGWNEFVRDAMPLVDGGTRRFSHAV